MELWKQVALVIGLVAVVIAILVVLTALGVKPALPTLLNQSQNASSSIVGVTAQDTQDYAKCVNTANSALYVQLYDPVSTGIDYKFEGDVQACDPATGQMVTVGRDNLINGVAASFSSGAVVELAVIVQDMGVVVVKERQLSVSLPVQP